MPVDRLSAYLPMDRRHALAAGLDLPDRAAGAVLLTDVTGFIPLTDALVAALGPRRGAEELIRLLNSLHDAIIAPVHAHGGSVVGFSGDGFVAWFDADPGLQAVACGLAMQQAMVPFAVVETPGGTVSLTLKVAVAAGPVRRFLVGAPRVDLLAGAVLDRLVQAEQAAGSAEVVVGPAVVQGLGDQLLVTRPCGKLAVVERLTAEAATVPWPALAPNALTAEQVRPYLLPPVYERLLADSADSEGRTDPGQRGEFLAELRPAAALFLHFGGLDYDRDDDAGARLDAYVRWVQEVLERYEGTLLQLTTDEKGSYLYAAFGALAAHEDDAERAVAAALELRRPPPDLAFITGVQIGVGQGRVRAGAYGSPTRRTYGAQGDAVNVAARLMAAAPAGEIWCSPAVRQAAGERWIFEALPAVRLQGKPEPLPVYRPLGQTRRRGPRITGALVGRHAEMGNLARLLAEVGTGQRRVLLLEGEAGIGKSRLVVELAQLAREQGATWLEGAGQSIEPQTPYRAWRDLLAAYLGLDEEMDLAERQRQVRKRVVAANPTLAERIPLLNDILRLDLPETDLTRGFAPRLRHESLTALVVDLLRAVTLRQAQDRPGPLVLVLEDAHWLDSLSWELALSVARAFVGQPLLLLLALRPLEEPLQAEYTALAGLEGAATLRLETLPPAETVALAAARLGVASAALPPEAAALVRERAGGNPFFAEELAYVLRDSGAVVVEERACTLVGDLTTLRERVPDTVEGVVLARIDRLPPEVQLTLKAAAVVGRSFLYRTLRDVHPQQVVEDLLQAHLDDLTRRDLTRLEAVEPEQSYFFKHVITQQVAYDTLLFAQRRALHRAVAGWYERAYTDNPSPYYPLLVHHWRRAEDVEQERHYTRLAGEQAAAQFANVEAVTYLSRALDLTPEANVAGRYDLLLAREKVYDLQGAREAQVQDLEALESLAETLDENAQPHTVGLRRAEVALRRARCAEATGDYAAAIAAVQATTDLVSQGATLADGEINLEAAHLQALGYLQWGRAVWRLGDFVAASSRIEQALALAQAAQLRQVEADSLRILGNVCLDLGNYAASNAYYEQALRIHRSIGDRYGEGASLNNLGISSHRQGDYAAARAYYAQSLHIFREIGSREGESLLYDNLGMAYRDQGDYVGARAFIEQALRIIREIDDRPGEGQALDTLGLVLADLGDYARARDCHLQALHIKRKIGERLEENVTLAYLAALSARQGENEAARQYSQQALRIAQDLGARHRQGFALTNLGHALAGLGYSTEAADAYRQALELRRELGEPPLAMETLAGLARVALTQENISQAQAQVEEILDYLKANSLGGIEDPFRVYLTCYQVLDADRDPRAQEILTTAYHLLQEWAARIADEELRRSFLENVAVNRDLVAAYQAMSARRET